MVVMLAPMVPMVWSVMQAAPATWDFWARLVRAAMVEPGGLAVMVIRLAFLGASGVMAELAELVF